MMFVTRMVMAPVPGWRGLTMPEPGGGPVVAGSTVALLHGMAAGGFPRARTHVGQRVGGKHHGQCGHQCHKKPFHR